MPKYLLPHFGELETDNLESYYNVTIVLDGHEMQLDLNFENSSVDVKYLDAVKQFIANIPDFDKQNKQYMETDYTDENGDTVRSYVAHHLEEINMEELSEHIDFDNGILSPEIQLMNALKLVRIGFYPETENQFAIFDYSIGQDLTPYLVVINTDQSGNLDYLTMES